MMRETAIDKKTSLGAAVVAGKTPTRRAVLGGAAALSALPLLSACQTRDAAAAPAADIDLFVEERMAFHRVPGAAIARIENGQLAWERGYGMANLDTATPVTNQTLFQAASLSKPIFAYVVMQAVERGVIDLDETLAAHARPPGLTEEPWSDQVTVRDVLKHTTGLPNWRPMEEALELKPAYEPGTDTSYSGEAYSWLQRVLEVRMGRGLDPIMRDYLFEPAGLGDMSMLWEAARDDREVYGHEINEDGELVVKDLQFVREQGWRLHEVAERWGKPMRSWTVEDQERALSEMRPHSHARTKDRPAWRWTHPNYLRINSPATLRTTAGDFARFACLMMPGRDRADWEISEATRQFMLTPQYQRPDVQGGVLPRGIGWGLETRGDDVAYYHWGSNSRTHISVVVGDPSDRSGIVVMTNIGAGRKLIHDVVLELTGKNYIGVSTS